MAHTITINKIKDEGKVSEITTTKTQVGKWERITTYDCGMEYYRRLTLKGVALSLSLKVAGGIIGIGAGYLVGATLERYTPGFSQHVLNAYNCVTHAGATGDISGLAEIVGMTYFFAKSGIEVDDKDPDLLKSYSITPFIHFIGNQ